MKKSNKIVVIIVIVAVLVAILRAFAVNEIDRRTNEAIGARTDAEIEAAREEYCQSVKTLEIYEPKDGDYIESVTVVDSGEDTEEDENIVFTNIETVTVKMEDSFDELPMQTRIEMYDDISYKLGLKLMDNFENSQYNQMRYQNSKYAKYHDKYLDIYQGSDFVFSTSDFEYTLTEDLLFKVTQRATGEEEFYEFHYKDGKVVDFKKR